MAPEFGKPIQQLPLIPADVLKKHRVHELLDTRFRRHMSWRNTHVTPSLPIYRKPAPTLRQGSDAPQGGEEQRSLDGQPYPELRLVARLDRT
jgi:hypothetical protein